MRKFEFKKSYEEVQIDEKVFRIDFSDNKTSQYPKKLQEFKEEFTKLQSTDQTNFSDQEKLDYFDQIKQGVKKVIEEFFGEGSFEEIYVLSGCSIINVMDLIFYISDVVSERLQKDREDKRSYYVNKK